MNKLLFLFTLFLVSCGQPTTSENSKGSIISSSIIGGENVIEGDLVKKSVLKFNGCSGTLIAENLIVTAAHCVTEIKPGLFKSKLVKLNKVAIWIDQFTYVMSGDIIYNSKFTGAGSTDNDIAVIKLEKLLPNDKFKPVSILAPEYLLDENTELLLAGYGLQSAKSSTQNYFLNPLQKIKKSFLKYEKDLLIIKQDTGTSGVFHGDSGGPAFLETQTELLLVGAIEGAKTDSSPTANITNITNISAHKDFILESAKTLNASVPVFKMPNE